MRPGRRHGRVAIGVLAFALAAGVLAGCLPTTPPTALAISAPLMSPAFSPGVSDYVVRCTDGAPLPVSVEAPSGTQVSIDHQAWASGRFTASVTLSTDEAFTIDVQQPGMAQTTAYVRCLPADFPFWVASHGGSTRSEFFMTTPLAPTGAWYPTIFDANGTPVWWGDRVATVYNTLLSNGRVGSLTPAGLEERTLSGQLVRTVPVTGGVLDQHDVVILPNGHVVLVANVARDNVDLSAMGGPSNTSILDHVIQEIDPATNQVVWSWDVADHIPVQEMDPQWWGPFITSGTAPYDVYHWNSIEFTGGTYLLSFRHLDAVYEIDAATGDILWKLGGTPRSESLTVQSDPVFDGGSHFGGQHDARQLADGTVTLYDDGTNLRPPRVVRYRVDTGARTATLVESMADPSVPSTYCCGSARWLGPFDWVIGWGGDPNGTGTESVAGQRAFSLRFLGLIMYRLEPLRGDQVNRVMLRAAMDARAATTSSQGAGQDASSSPAGPIPFPP